MRLTLLGLIVVTIGVVLVRQLMCQRRMGESSYVPMSRERRQMLARLDKKQELEQADVGVSY